MVSRFRAAIHSPNAKIKHLLNNNGKRKLGRMFLLNQYLEGY